MNEKNLLRIDYRAMIRRKKWNSDFPITKNAKTSAHILETQIPVGNMMNFPNFDGLYTIKSDRDITEHSDMSETPFLSASKRVAGFLEVDGAIGVDLTSNRKKIVKTITASVFHFFADEVCDILSALKMYPDAEVIIDLSYVQKFLNRPSWSFMGFFLDALQDQGIKCRFIDASKFDIIYINNYCVAESVHRSSMSGPMIYEFFKKYVDKPDTVPYRNVYLSRKQVYKDNSEAETKTSQLSYKTDDRVDSEDKLIEIFSELGFEIVAPEDFKDFHEQINFFYSVKTLASLTSSGLTNALFMQPGGTVIEVSTPQVVYSPILLGDPRLEHIEKIENSDPLVVQELHMFYKLISYLKDHTYLSINNPDRSFENIRDVIYGNKKLLEFIDNNDKSNNL